MIPIILYVRASSTRCSNKLLRSFADGRNLVEICLSKFAGRQDVFVAAYENEFRDLASKYNVGFIPRTYESSIAENHIDIHSYLPDIEHNVVCLLNVCCPFVRAATVDDAISTKQRLGVPSLFSVQESCEVTFSNKGQILNTDNVFNSKLRIPLYVGNNAIVIFDKRQLFSTGFYWSYTQNDPYLYVMSKEESVDIDTEMDFKIAQVLWKSFLGSDHPSNNT